MLTQADVLRLLSKPEPIPQVVVFSILHAYVFSKSRRGNLPSETLAKVLSIQRKLQLKTGRALPAGGPVASAFDAMKSQLLRVNRLWVSQGAQAFGPLGAVGATAGHVDAKWAWVRATDGAIKEFPDENGAAMRWYGAEMDAGRVVGPEYLGSADPLADLARYSGGGGAPDPNAPPSYDAPPDDDVVQALNERRREEETGEETEGRGAAWRDSVDEGIERDRRMSDSPAPRGSIDEGAAHLARLRRLKEEKEAQEAAREQQNGQTST
ncbi:uncharacterized protein JCM10292_002350 [Rhodotorula paludigena]|uniref:uncharacterized protein n=1 Tax=Rhodotorula paludigena TaxID=86838 RepID=UPI00316BB415